MAGKGKPGRKTKLTKTLIKEIGDALRNGLSIVPACQLVGISDTLYHDWIRIANHTPEGEENDYVLFRDTVKHAIAEAENELAGVVRSAAKFDWKAAMTMMERRWPERWGRRSIIKVEAEKVPEELPRELELDNLSTEEIVTLESLMRKAGKP